MPVHSFLTQQIMTSKQESKSQQSASKESASKENEQKHQQSGAASKAVAPDQGSNDTQALDSLLETLGGD
ncbi:MAG TPA: hypothetical protein V6C50_01720, partial [Crinalium sp.]